MSEREKVIKALDTHLSPPTVCDDCLYVDVGRNCYRLLLTDALKLLKEQEAEPQTVLFREDGEYCPRCSTITTRIMGVQKLHRGTKFCPYCGQAVKWDG